VTVRVLLVDDQAMVRAGFRLILETEDDLEVVGEAEDGGKAIAAAESTRPDVVLMDVQMPVMDGLEATRRIVAAARDGRPRVLILTTFERDEYIFEALRAGASGFLLKNAPADDLIDALRIVAAGEALLAPSVTRRIIAEFARRPVAPNRTLDLSQLTEREVDVLRLMARGMSNAEIAASLSVGEATIKTHVSNILTKLDLRDRVKAVVLAYESGLVLPGSV
jgi:DNA-binding NarL/FixJ family response regulator